MALGPIPKFANEAAEAKWWFEHRNQLSEDLIRASKSGSSGRGSRERYAERLRLKTKGVSSHPEEIRPSLAGIRTISPQLPLRVSNVTSAGHVDAVVDRKSVV